MFANIIPTPEAGGIRYCTDVALTATEASLGDGIETATIIAVVGGRAVVAVVVLAIDGTDTSNSCYVVMQMDMGDGVWVDVAWIIWTGVTGSATFAIGAGGLGAENNAIQQTRAPGTPPGALGSVALPLGGRIRFVGKATVVGADPVLATITYRMVEPR